MAGGLIDAFNRINVGIFVLDSLRRVLFSNSLASELIGDGFEVVDGGLQLTHVKGPAEHSEILSNPIGHPPGPFQTRPVLVNRRSTQRPSIAYLIPLKSSQAAAFLARANTIVLIINPDEAVAPDPSLLRDILGITLGEARVASLVGTGWPPKETAKKLGIADETVRTVLKRVYAKVGVSRQSELSGLIARLRIGDAAGPQA
jgi:DNA-binding CsgD family transcriptional regulator